MAIMAAVQRIVVLKILLADIGFLSFLRPFLKEMKGSRRVWGPLRYWALQLAKSPHFIGRRQLPIGFLLSCNLSQVYYLEIERKRALAGDETSGTVLSDIQPRPLHQN